MSYSFLESAEYRNTPSIVAQTEATYSVLADANADRTVLSAAKIVHEEVLRLNPSRLRPLPLQTLISPAVRFTQPGFSFSEMMSIDLLHLWEDGLGHRGIKVFFAELGESSFDYVRKNLATASFAYSDGVLTRDTFRGIVNREIFLNGRERMSLIRLLIHSITRRVVVDKHVRNIIRISFELIILFNTILRGRVTLAAKLFIYDMVPHFMKLYPAAFPSSNDTNCPKFHALTHLLWWMLIFGSLGNVALHVFENAHLLTKLDALHVNASANVALSLVNRFVRRFTAARVPQLLGAPLTYLPGTQIPSEPVTVTFHVWGTHTDGDVPLSMTELETLWKKHETDLICRGTSNVPKSPYHFYRVQWLAKVMFSRFDEGVWVNKNAGIGVGAVVRLKTTGQRLIPAVALYYIDGFFKLDGFCVENNGREAVFAVVRRLVRIAHSEYDHPLIRTEIRSCDKSIAEIIRVDSIFSTLLCERVFSDPAAACTGTATGTVASEDALLPATTRAYLPIHFD